MNTRAHVAGPRAGRQLFRELERLCNKWGQAVRSSAVNGRRNEKSFPRGVAPRGCLGSAPGGSSAAAGPTALGRTRGRACARLALALTWRAGPAWDLLRRCARFRCASRLACVVHSVGQSRLASCDSSTRAGKSARAAFVRSGPCWVKRERGPAQQTKLTSGRRLSVATAAAAAAAFCGGRLSASRLREGASNSESQIVWSAVGPKLRDKKSEKWATLREFPNGELRLAAMPAPRSYIIYDNDQGCLRSPIDKFVKICPDGRPSTVCLAGVGRGLVSAWPALEIATRNSSNAKYEQRGIADALTLTLAVRTSFGKTSAKWAACRWSRFELSTGVLEIWKTLRKTRSLARSHFSQLLTFAKRFAPCANLSKAGGGGLERQLCVAQPLASGHSAGKTCFSENSALDLARLVSDRTSETTIDFRGWRAGGRAGTGRLLVALRWPTSFALGMSFAHSPIRSRLSRLLVKLIPRQFGATRAREANQARPGGPLIESRSRANGRAPAISRCAGAAGAAELLTENCSLAIYERLASRAAATDHHHPIARCHDARDSSKFKLARGGATMRAAR
ncbi:Hypothetical predicted protein [Olea europaea subsp. europaea]|uniref:Uncharacterized protein n=1 Tax=Olea europaea subsp. europaea TaxID=158383 RepID=A0A8S0TNH0_OLEEU|nr:Hypothetical predicted protein [Olea europaea subsp. europaea]